MMASASFTPGDRQRGPFVTAAVRRRLLRGTRVDGFFFWELDPALPLFKGEMEGVVLTSIL